PAERECTHRKLRHRGNTFLNKSREPDQLSITLASVVTSANASAEFPTTIRIPPSFSLNKSSCGSSGSAKTSIVLFFIASLSGPQLHHTKIDIAKNPLLKYAALLELPLRRKSHASKRFQIPSEPSLVRTRRSPLFRPPFPRCFHGLRPGRLRR